MLMRIAGAEGMKSKYENNGLFGCSIIREFTTFWVDFKCVFLDIAFFQEVTTFSDDWSNGFNSTFAQICVIAVATGWTRIVTLLLKKTYNNFDKVLNDVKRWQNKIFKVTFLKLSR